MASVNFTRALSPAGRPTPVRPVDSSPCRQQAVAEALKAADLYDAAGEPAYAAGLRNQAARMRKAIAS